MSGPEDTRESAVPPAGGPPADAQAAETASAETAGAAVRPPAFGLEAPWWAAESSDTAPPEADAEDEGELVFGARPAEERPDEERPAEPPAERPAGPETIAVPPGTLVAGVGVPSVDSRRAVPAEPLVKRPPSFGDTDPDGFPPVRPEDGAAPEETVVDAPVEQQQPMEAVPPRPETDAAFEKAKQAENAASASLAPVLVPDAILPPGVTPPTG
ncbi:MAG: hypothetical protein ACRDNL_23310, partial [Spirillospora sp.]